MSVRRTDTVLPPVGRLLGVDLGTVRIGLALSDSSQLLASPLEILGRSGDAAADRARIAERVAEHGCVGVVVGLPLALSGVAGPAARAAEVEIAALAEMLPVPVRAVDERLSSVEVTRRRTESGTTRRRRRQPVDDRAAALVLQRHLDELPRRRGTEGER